jgi:hypothetical protein
MKNLIRKSIVLELPITSKLGIKNGISLLRKPKDEKAVLMNLAIQLIALLLTLPVITALLLVWFEIK